MIVKMKDICTKIGSGATPKGGKDSYIDEGISLIRSQNILDFFFSHDGLTHINEEQARKLNGVTVEVDDVLLNITGDSVARVCIVDNDVLPARVNQHVCIVRGDKDKVLNSFILYFLQMKKPELLQMASGGATRNALTKGMIEELDIDLPTIEEQKKIVSLLDSIQEKLKTNNKINRNLDDQLTAIYNEWFGKFKPFNIGVGGDPEYKLEDGWKIEDIYSIANIIYGAPFSSKLFNTKGEGTPIIRIRDLKNQEFTTYTTEHHQKGYLIQRGDIVVGMDGEFRPYIWGNDEAWLNQRVCVFNNLREKGKAYLYCTIKPLLYSVEATEVATTVIHIGKKDYDEFRVVIPPEDILNEFEMISKPMYDQIVEGQIENRRLTQLRDSLLPKLMSGELDVSELDI